MPSGLRGACSAELGRMCTSPLAAWAGKGVRRPVVLCFGDSHTHGFHGPNWVGMLQSQYPSMVFINCGVNGEVLESITNRLEGVLKSHPDVVGVLLLGGTNDCLASLSPSATTLIRVYNPWLKDVPKLEAYRATARRFLDTVAQFFPRAKVGWLTLPLITEDLESAPNAVVATINGMIREVAGQYPTWRLQVLDLNTAMRRYLEKNPRRPDARPTVPFVPEFGPMLGHSTWAVVRDVLFFESWNAIADSRGATLLSDHVHLTERSVELLLSLVVPLVEGIKAQAMGLPPPLPTENQDSDYHPRPKSYDELGKKALRPLSDQLALATPRTDVSSDEELSSPIFSSPVSQRDLHDVDISITLAATRRAQSTLRNAPQEMDV